MKKSQRRKSEVWAWTFALLRYSFLLGTILVALRLGLTALMQDVDLLMELRVLGAFVVSGAVFGFLIGLLVAGYRKHWEKRRPELAEEDPSAK